MQIKILEQHALAHHFLELVRKTLSDAEHADRRASMAISGGSVAEAFLPSLVELGESAQRLDVFWCDERMVPLDDAQSNYHQAKQLWLDPANIPSGQVFPLFGLGSGPETAEDYERVLRGRGERPLDIALLGVGPDGHVASLFPHDAALKVERWVEFVEASPKPPPCRLTLTLSLLARVPRLVIAAFGSSKAQVVADALGGDTTLPLQRLFHVAPHALLLLDAQAASVISRESKGRPVA